MDRSVSKEPRFSIVIPTYNRAEKVKKCVESVLRQTNQDFEILICDDGSNDGTKDILNSYIDNEKVRYFYNDNWGGPAFPRNTGIRNARAEWICFIDSDDTWEPRKLERASQYLSEFDFICHNFSIVGTRNIKRTIRTADLSCNPLEKLLTNGNSIVTSSVCVRKNILEELDGFSLAKELIAVEDFDLWLKIAEKGYRFKVISESLGNYYTGEGNITESSPKQIARINTVFGLHQSKLKPTDPMLYRSQGYTGYLTGRIFHEIKDLPNAREGYKKAIRQGIFSIKWKALLCLMRSWLH